MITTRVQVAQATPAQMEAAIGVAVAAQQATGFPTNVAPADLPLRWRQRQIGALSVWVACDGDAVVGHGLVAPIASWSPFWALGDPEVVAALDSGRLVELGALSVHPDRHGEGIAEALVRARLEWVRKLGLTACATVWRDSPGAVALASRYGRCVGAHDVRPQDLFLYS